jgi:hypothetical protein
MAANGPGLGHLERGFIDQVDSMLSSLGYFLSIPARQVLLSMAIAALQNMRSSGEPGPEDINRLQTSISRLVEELSAQAKLEQQRRAQEARGRGIDELELMKVRTIDPEIIELAMSSLCPGFWPFC